MFTPSQQSSAPIARAGLAAHLMTTPVWLTFVIAIACGLVISTYSVFGHTWDEPEHIAAGMALVDRGEYPYDTQHPPLARIAMAIGPYLAGARSQGNEGPSGEEEGRDILYGEHYMKYLTLARVGMLPFLIALLIAVWLWSKHLYGQRAAVLATLFVVTTPIVIGHAGVAALDIPMVGTSLLACYLLLRWIEQPTWKRAVGVGLASGIAFGTKLSAIPFIGVVAIAWVAAALLLFRRAQTPVAQSSTAQAADATTKSIAISYISTAIIAAIAAYFALVACYGWRWVPFSDSIPIPVPIGVLRLSDSLDTLMEHNGAGHLSYFMGELKRSGWWDFYSVGLLVKTPLPLLISAVLGLIWLSYRALQTRDWRACSPTIAFVSILIFASAYSHINIGMRHVLILYPMMAVSAGAVVSELWDRYPQRQWRAALAIVVGLQVTQMAYAHPDYLATFNLLAGNHPEKILIDSDLDWGQDLKRLEREMRRRNIDQYYLVYRGTADLEREGLTHVTRLWPNQRVTGWVAVSLLAKATGSEDGGYDWLNAYTPVTRVGKSIDLYYIEK